MFSEQMIFPKIATARSGDGTGGWKAPTIVRKEITVKEGDGAVDGMDLIVAKL